MYVTKKKHPLLNNLFNLPLCSKVRFNRCIPVDITCYAQFAQAIVNSISENVFEKVVIGVLASKEIIFGLCVLSVGMCVLLINHCETVFFFFHHIDFIYMYSMCLYLIYFFTLAQHLICHV